MSSYRVRETFFRPDEPVGTEVTTLPAALANGLRLLVTRADGDGVFIPIRSMQYLAVADSEEVIFVDAQGGYAYRDGEGGRLIQLTWRPIFSRDSLATPTPCRMVYYFPDMVRTQSRLLVEMAPAVEQLLTSHREAGLKTGERRVLPLKQSNRAEPEKK